MPEIKKEQKAAAPCPLYKKCGGCQLQNLNYEEQLRWKERRMIGLMGQFGHVEPVIGMERPLHYRNKVQAAFGLDRKKRIISGVYQSSTHRIVPVDRCMIENEAADAIIVTVRRLLADFKLLPYHADTGRGFLRHVLVRRGFSTGQVMVVLVTGSPVFPSKNHFVGALLKKHPEITTVLQNINPGRTSLVLGTQEKTLFGPGFIEDELCGCVFRISAQSFYQINPVQTQVLYETAMEYAALSGQETVVDAYCGTGTIGLIAARRGAKQVVGVEINREAVRDAIANAKRNQIKNARFYCADAGAWMRDMAAAGEQADVVLMDPPRAGSDEAFLSSVLTLAPKRVVYISCNPETLARDVLFLTKRGYRVQRIQPVDMFPFTNHIETVVLLSKLKVDHHIEIELKMDELDLTAAESKATYDEIKAYVLNKYGLKVSQLYIAQIKRKCGIIERKNYNVSKKEDAKVPQCPPEKEAAIMDALKHFQMI